MVTPPPGEEASTKPWIAKRRVLAPFTRSPSGAGRGRITAPVVSRRRVAPGVDDREDVDEPLLGRARLLDDAVVEIDLVQRGVERDEEIGLGGAGPVGDVETGEHRADGLDVALHVARGRLGTVEVDRLAEGARTGDHQLAAGRLVDEAGEAACPGIDGEPVERTVEAS